jgi:hypothetical protein
MDVADALAEAQQIIAAGDGVTYPSGAAARHVRSVIRNLAEALKEARPTQVDFVEIPKGHLFSPEEAAARELWARRFVTEITGVARGLGYGMFHGGSLIRDIDLVAVPWRGGTWRGVSTELAHLDFVLALCHCLPLQLGHHGETLFGHRWYALWHRGHRDHQIDLKVMLPAARQGEV